MGSKNNTATTTSSANPTAQQAYLGLLGQVQQTAQTPYQAYTGELVPGVNAQQTTGINSINQNANYAQPFIGQAAGLATQAATPLTAAQIQQYQSPYTQSVVNSTEAQFNNQNQQQQQQVTGNAIAQGALGGNRTAVAQSELANQQQLAQAPVIAGLENQGYQTGLNTALSQQQAQAQGAYSLGNLGVSGQNAALTGANAQVGAGNLQYGVSSAQDQAAYQQFLNQQAFPYQQLQWASGLESGLGSNLGGTSTTTSPGPSVWSQILGLGEAAAGTAGKFATAGAARGGRIHGYAVGGTPYSGGVGYIPQSMQISRGRGIPNPPGMGGQGGQSGGAGGGLSGAGGSFGDLGVAAKNLYNGYNSNGTASGDQWVQAGQGQGVYAPIDTPDDYVGGIGHAYRGGRIGYDDGGSVNLVVPNGDYTPDNRMNLGLASGFNYATALSPEIMQQYTADMAHKYGPQWRQMRAPAMTAYSKGYADGGTPDSAGVDDPDSAYNLGLAPNGIDASDIVMNGGTGGLGLGAKYEPTNAAISADARYTPNGDVLPPEIMQGHSGPTQGVAPTHAMAFTTDGTDQSPDYVRDRNNVVPSSDLTYQHPKTDIWGGLIAAGLGTMASRSPFVGTAIGEGGLAGLREYSAEQAQNISEAEKKTNFAQQNKRIDLESTRLDQAAKQAQDRLNLETEAQQHGTWYQQQEANKPVIMRQDVDQFGITHPVYGIRRPDGSFADPTTGQPVPPLETPSSRASGTQVAAGDSFVPEPGDLVGRNPDVLAAHPDLANTIKAVADGRANLGSVGYKQRTMLMQLVNQYDPSWDQTTWAARNKEQSDLTTNGNAGKMILAVNQLLPHLQVLSDKAEALNNSSYPAANSVANWWATATGDPRVKTFEEVREVAATDAARLLRGTGQMAEKDIDFWRNNISSAGSPAQLQDQFNTLADELMGARIKSIEQGYRTVMGREPPQFVSKEAQGALTAIRARKPGGQQPGAGSSALAQKVDPATRYQQLTSGGMSKADAYATMHKEGY